MTFDEAFERLLGHEGGYTPGRNDPGGETKWGVSKRSYPAEDILNLTKERAKEIYRRDFWTPAGCESLPPRIRFDVFDMAVNSGVRAAVKLLQTSAGVTADGVIGPVTLHAAKATEPARLLAHFNGGRLQFMTGLAVWPAFGKGWARRIAANLMEA